MTSQPHTECLAFFLTIGIWLDPTEAESCALGHLVKEYIGISMDYEISGVMRRTKTRVLNVASFDFVGFSNRFQGCMVCDP